MKNQLYRIKSALEKLDGLRDRVLFIFIKPFWPRAVTPNHLTIARIIIGLSLFVGLFYYDNPSHTTVVWLFLIGALTDLLDGSIARGLGMETPVGALLDPIADRILIIPIAFYSLFSSHRWLFLILILLEVTSGLVSIYSYSKNIPPTVTVNIFGKVKMVLQSIVFLAVLVFWLHVPVFFIYLLWISAGFIVASAILKIIETKNYHAA